MGGHVNFTLYIKKDKNLIELKKKLARQLQNLELIFSHYNEKSQLRKLTENYQVSKKYPLNKELFFVLAYSVYLWVISDNLFDVTIHALSRQWKLAINQREIPKKLLLNQLSARVSSSYFSLNHCDKSILFHKKGISFDLGGIAKGYILDNLLSYLQKNSIDYAIINFGGDVIFSQPPPHKKYWETQIFTANGIIKKKFYEQGSLATSGTTQQYFIQENELYSHIVNPKTLSTKTHKKQVSVWGKSAMVTDAIATVLMLKNSKEAKQFMDKYFPNYQYLIL